MPNKMKTYDIYLEDILMAIVKSGKPAYMTHEGTTVNITPNYQENEIVVSVYKNNERVDGARFKLGQDTQDLIDYLFGIYIIRYDDGSSSGFSEDSIRQYFYNLVKGA